MIPPNRAQLSECALCSLHHFTRARTTAGAAEVAALHEQVLSMYKAAGGQLDFWAVDDESSSVMHSCVKAECALQR